MHHLTYFLGLDSLVDVAIHYALDGPGIEFWWGRQELP
jgi:hypothetical protein